MRKKIIYITAEGQSGTTLLDIVLGSRKDVFSAGELIFFPKKGLLERQFCACGKSVPECEIWSNVEKEWHRKLQLEHYVEISYRLHSKKNFLKIRNILKNPSDETTAFIDDTKALYEAIFKVTGCHTIVNSSKAPLHLPILEIMDFEIEVVHMIRRFGDVLNSNKRSASKDVSIGREAPVIPKRTSRVLVSWTMKNIMINWLSRSLPRTKVKYEELVLNPKETLIKLAGNDDVYIEKLNNRGPFRADHLVAGNKIRLQEKHWIADKPMNSDYSRLKLSDKILAIPIDLLYYIMLGFRDNK